MTYPCHATLVPFIFLQTSACVWHPYATHVGCIIFISKAVHLADSTMNRQRIPFSRCWETSLVDSYTETYQTTIDITIAVLYHDRHDHYDHHGHRRRQARISVSYLKGTCKPSWVLYLNTHQWNTGSSSHGNNSHDTGTLWGESTSNRWIPLIKFSDVWSAPEQTAEQTIETPVIWDAVTLIMTSLNEYPEFSNGRY